MYDIHFMHDSYVPKHVSREVHVQTNSTFLGYCGNGTLCKKTSI